MTARFLFNNAMDGFILSCQARRLSPYTIADYSNTLRKLCKFVENKPIDEITRNDIRSFLAIQTVGNKTLLNYHTGLSAFFKWALNEELVGINPVVGVARPKPEQRVIQPIPEEHIRAILKSIGKSDYSLRHRALILLLLDTGMRVSEICSLTKRNTDLKAKSLKLIGKNNKERILYFSPTTAQALWKYCAQHDGIYLFATKDGFQLDRNNIRHVLERLCKKAGVPAYSPHDFRHTFAVNFLRNYPNIYALQQMLGHSTLDMVKRYLAISERDIQQAHKHASPVENWKL